MRYSIIIIGLNEENNLDDCIKSALNQDYTEHEYEVIYVDNGSDDDSVTIANAHKIRVEHEKTKGVGNARNKGIAAAKGDFLLFIDADSRLTPSYLMKLDMSFEDERIAVAGGRILPLKRTWVSNYLGVSLIESYRRDSLKRMVKSHPGCNLAVRKKALDDAGSFDSGLKSAKGIVRFREEIALCARLRGKGYSIQYNPDAIVYHDNPSTFRQLLRVWALGSLSRLMMIRGGSKDMLSMIFKYNLPFLSLIVFIISCFSCPPLAILLIATYTLTIASLSIKSLISTGMFPQCLIIKPIMDTLSLVVVNAAMLYYRWRSDDECE